MTAIFDAEIHYALDCLIMQLCICFQSILCYKLLWLSVFLIPMWCHLISKFNLWCVHIFMSSFSEQSLIALLCVDPATYVLFYLILNEKNTISSSHLGKLAAQFSAFKSQSISRWDRSSKFFLLIFISRLLTQIIQLLYSLS